MTRERQEWMENTIDFFRSLCLNLPNANGIEGVVSFYDEDDILERMTFAFIYRGKKFQATLILTPHSNHWKFEIRSQNDYIETTGKKWHVNVAESDEYFYRNSPIPTGRCSFNKLEQAMEFFHPIYNCPFYISDVLIKDF